MVPETAGDGQAVIGGEAGGHVGLVDDGAHEVGSQMRVGVGEHPESVSEAEEAVNVLEQLRLVAGEVRGELAPGVAPAVHEPAGGAALVTPLPHGYLLSLISLYIQRERRRERGRKPGSSLVAQRTKSREREPGNETASKTRERGRVGGLVGSNNLVSLKLRAKKGAYTTSV